MPRARQNRIVTQWVADFETTTDPEDCRVWAWGLGMVCERPEVEMGNSIQSFFARVSKMNSKVYFHNLQFDGKFILDALMRGGYEHVEDHPRRGELSTMISDDGKFYMITVRWRNGQRTEFRDSLKKIPMSVAQIAKAYKLEILKGELDYQAYRPKGHILTEEERAYLWNDVSIVAQALAIQMDEGMVKLTVGSDSLYSYKQMIGGQKMFRNIFPLLPPETDADIRHSYRGGFTYAAEKYKGKIVGPGRVFDVNSLYPSVMRYALLPYGFPVPFTSYPVPQDDYPLFVVNITFTAKLKDGFIPCIQIKNSPHYVNTEYQSEIKEPISKWVTSVDLEIWQKHYDMNIISWDGGYYFHASTGLFDDYVDYWSKIKESSEGGLKAIAKLHLNSLYGKFASNPDKTGKVPYYDPDKNIIRYHMGSPEIADPVYTPMGVFITAYARKVTLMAAQDNFDSFAYADTDSIHLVTERDPSGLEIHPTKLGAWKREMIFDRALFVRAKCYVEEIKTEDGWESHTHVAGLPLSVAKHVGIGDFVDGATFRGKLSPKVVPGGVVLEDVGFTLNM